MRVFEIETPDGRRVRHQAVDAGSALAQLMPGYALAGEVIGADAAQRGGWVIPAGQGESPLAILLRLYGDDMLAWMRAQGLLKTDP